MQVILHNAAVEQMDVALRSVGVTLGDPLELEADDEGGVGVVACRVSGWLRLFGQRERRVRLGRLCPDAAEIVAPALRAGVDLRVRVVEICPAHLSADGRDQLGLSVWGDRDRLARLNRPAGLPPVAVTRQAAHQSGH